MAENVIELRNLTKVYGKARGVQELNLRVEPGTVFGFLGPNGAGKSTTINMIMDFIRPTSGSVKIFGLDASRDSIQVHKRLGFLADGMAMDDNLTGWQQLEYFGRLRNDFDKAYITELSNRLHCNLHRKFKTLSRGNRQKVGLITALMHKPELLVLDEPTSGLDPLIQAEFNKIIHEHKQAGGTAFISSHVLSEVQEICDTVTFIREGRLIATKPVSEIAKESPKEFSITTSNKGLLSALQKLAGMTISEKTTSGAHGHFTGDVNDLIHVLAKYEIDTFTFQDAELETTFMKYYEEEANDA